MGRLVHIRNGQKGSPQVRPMKGVKTLPSFVFEASRLFFSISLLSAFPLAGAAVSDAMAIVAQTPDILGERQSGQDVRTENGRRSVLCRKVGIFRYFVRILILTI